MKDKLMPLKEIGQKVCSVARVCVVDGRKFLDTMRHEHVFFAIVCKDGKVEVKELQKLQICWKNFKILS